jgi:hypothetical protein
MPAKLNTEFNYRYQVIGETAWEKIKTLKGFLEGRVRAAALEQVAEIKYQSKLAKIQHLKDTNAPAYELLEAQAELVESESFRNTEAQAFELNRQEIKILENLLAEYYTIAEPTRIPGYTDEQMFEANAANEFTATIGKEIYAEMLATGRPSPAKLRNAMSNPHTWFALKEAGLVPAGAALLEAGADPNDIRLTPIPYTAKELEHIEKLNKLPEQMSQHNFAGQQL